MVVIIRTEYVRQIIKLLPEKLALHFQALKNIFVVLQNKFVALNCAFRTSRLPNNAVFKPKCCVQI